MKTEKPKQVKLYDVDDFCLFRDECQKYIDWVASDDFNEDGISDFEYSIFEKAMFMTFGKEVFKFINERNE